MQSFIIAGLVVTASVVHAQDQHTDCRDQHMNGPESCSNRPLDVPVRGAPHVLTAAPAGRVGDDYDAMLVTGGSGDYTASVDGTLPPGLSVQSDGRLVGVPEEAGTYRFSVILYDNVDPARQARGVWVIRIVDDR